MKKMRVNKSYSQQWRRRKLLFGAMGAGALAISGTARAVLNSTANQAEGPFYPRARDRFDDIDNDLVKVEGKVRDAGGEILQLSGIVRTSGGVPLAGARVEIWQCDVNGRYIHHRDRDDNNDPGFQGFGFSVTDSVGRYKFRTIRPVAYTGRTPHIHVKVLDTDGQELLTTQMYVAGESGNERDGLYRRMSDTEKQSVTVEIDRTDGGDFRAEFEIVV